MFLMFQETPERLRVYFDSLPKKCYATSTYSKEDIEFISSNTHLGDVLWRKVDGVNKAFESLAEHLFQKHPDVYPAEMATSERHQWALAVTGTRSFKSKTGSVPYLLPYLDIANCDVYGSSFDFKHTEDTVEVRTTRDFEAGEEVTFLYTHGANVHYLMSYGFVMRNNPYDNVEMDVMMPPSMCEPEARHNILQHISPRVSPQEAVDEHSGLQQLVFSGVKLWWNSVDRELYQALRVMSLRGKELVSFLTNPSDTAAAIHRISHRNDFHASQGMTMVADPERQHHVFAAMKDRHRLMNSSNYVERMVGILVDEYHRLLTKNVQVFSTCAGLDQCMKEMGATTPEDIVMHRKFDNGGDHLTSAFVNEVLNPAPQSQAPAAPPTAAEADTADTSTET
eukprot:GFYU01009876.1.p1 GENE.GFYU01009876.1~~GFYU01009876.1.p1  ORF type:complete len:447 (-),score=79.87 GFYU01009876.1:102-1286(-)